MTTTQMGRGAVCYSRSVMSHQATAVRRPVPPPLPSWEERAAFHEAGHVVFGYAVLGMPIFDVTIVPTKKHLGSVRPTKAAKVIDTPRKLPAGVGKTFVWLTSAYTLSGHAADAVLRNTCAMWLSPEFNEARQYMIDFHGRVTGPGFFHTCWTKTCEYLEDPPVWVCVDALARALLKHKTVDNGTASRIVMKTTQRQRTGFKII